MTGAAAGPAGRTSSDAYDEENVLLQANPPEAARRLWRLNPGRRGLYLGLILLALIVSSAPGTSAATRARVSSPDGLNLRAAPSTSAAVLALMPFGTPVDVLGAATSDGWYPVAALGQSGYALGTYLDFSAPAALPAQGNAIVAPADGLRLRAAPSTSADALATLPAGRVVQLLGDSTPDGWQHVSAPEGTGWVDGAYLQALPAAATPMLVRWYGHDFDGGVLACGGIFSADDPTVAATNGYPCGTQLQVCAQGSCVTVTVRDRGGMAAGQMDLSQAAFQKLAPLGVGVLNATVQVMTGGAAPASGSASSGQ